MKGEWKDRIGPAALGFVLWDNVRVDFVRVRMVLDMVIRVVGVDERGEGIRAVGLGMGT